MPDESQVPGDADEWWLTVVVEATAAVHPPAYLELPFTFDPPEGTR